MNRIDRPVLIRIAVLLLAVGLGSAFAPDPATASNGKEFELLALDTSAQIRPDGSMEVSELISYRFVGGPFTIGIRAFLAADRDRIQAFSAFEGDERLDVDQPSATPSGEWEWHLPAPVTDETHTYRLEYVVPSAIELGSDVGELYWQFLGTDHPGVGSVDVTIAMPETFPVAAHDTAPDDITVLRAWGHGPRSGTVDVAPRKVTLRVDDVAAGQYVEARLVMPGDAFTADATSGPRLATVIAEEGADIDATLAGDRGRSYEPPPPLGARLLGPVGALLGLVGAVGLWARFGREPTPDPLVGEYWREPLTDPPAVALANLSKGGVDLSRSIGATMIDLAQRGHLTIREVKHERLGPDKVIRHLTRTGRADNDLEPFEQRLMSYVFSRGPETTVDEITASARTDPTTARAFAAGFTSDITKAFEARKYKQKGNPGTKWIIVLAVAVALIGVVGLALGSALGIVGLVGAVAAATVAGIGLSNRTPAGADAAARAKGLKKYLEDFSNLQDAPAGHLILWERFLVYAVAFGVAGQLLRGLEARMPAVLNDPSFGVWYAGYGVRRFDTIDRFPSEFGGATAQAVAPSKSGSGGGFSGGGGGGGGGGGFGAR